MSGFAFLLAMSFEMRGSGNVCGYNIGKAVEVDLRVDGQSQHFGRIRVPGVRRRLRCGAASANDSEEQENWEGKH